MERSILEIIPSLKHINEFKEFILSINIFLDGVEVHMDNFLSYFDTYKATYRSCDSYPIELSHTIDGIKFYSIYKIEDFHHAR